MILIKTRLRHSVLQFEKPPKLLPRRLQPTQCLNIVLQHHLSPIAISMSWRPNEAPLVWLTVKFAHRESRRLAAAKQCYEIDVIELGSV